MHMKYMKRGLSKILFNDEHQLWTIPVCVDSTAAITMNTSKHPMRKTRHVESRYWYAQDSIMKGDVKLVKVDGATQQPANIGTKNMRDRSSQYYRYPFESPYQPT